MASKLRLKEQLERKKTFKTKLKVDDVVIVRSGKDKGKRGKILSFHPGSHAVVVEGVNIVKKTLKKTQENQTGGVHDQEAHIHVSNVMYYHAPSKKGVRVGYKRNEQGQRERYFKTEKQAASATVTGEGVSDA